MSEQSLSHDVERRTEVIIVCCHDLTDGSFPVGELFYFVAVIMTFYNCIVIQLPFEAKNLFIFFKLGSISK